MFKRKGCFSPFTAQILTLTKLSPMYMSSKKKKKSKIVKENRLNNYINGGKPFEGSIFKSYYTEV